MVLWVVGLGLVGDASGDDDLCDLLDLAPADRTGLALWERENMVNENFKECP